MIIVTCIYSFHDVITMSYVKYLVKSKFPM